MAQLRIEIAKPCGETWDQMTGTERVRHCGRCDQMVYDTKGLTEAEIRDLILQSEGRTCMRIFERADGTMITRDCPHGVTRSVMMGSPTVGRVPPPEVIDPAVRPFRRRTTIAMFIAVIFCAIVLVILVGRPRP